MYVCTMYVCMAIALCQLDSNAKASLEALLCEVFDL
jgi:hypothetical protein